MELKGSSKEHLGMDCSCDGCSTAPASGRKPTDLSRRGFVCSAVAGTAGILAGATVSAIRPALAQSTITPDEALKAMMDGNQRYVDGQLQSLNEDLSILKAK